MANNAINTAAEVAANIENMNNAVKANTPKTERRREYTASKRHEIPALWKVLGTARQGKLYSAVHACPLCR